MGSVDGYGRITGSGLCRMSIRDLPSLEVSQVCKDLSLACNRLLVAPYSRNLGGHGTRRSMAVDFIHRIYFGLVPAYACVRIVRVARHPSGRSQCLHRSHLSITVSTQLDFVSALNGVQQNQVVNDSLYTQTGVCLHFVTE